MTCPLQHSLYIGIYLSSGRNAQYISAGMYCAFIKMATVVQGCGQVVVPSIRIGQQYQESVFVRPNDNNLASTQLFRSKRSVHMAWQRPHHRMLRAEVRLWAQGGRAGAVHSERGARSAAAAAGGGALAQPAGREGPRAAQGCLRHPAAGADWAPPIRLQIIDFHLVDVNRYLGMRRPDCNPKRK
jgi:hypothetical protein